MYGPPDQSRAVQFGYSFTPAQLPPPELLAELELEELELEEELEELELDELDELELVELELLELEEELDEDDVEPLPQSTPPLLHCPWFSQVCWPIQLCPFS